MPRAAGLKIALNHTQYGPAGGAEGYLRRLVDRLWAQGHEIHFYGRKVVSVDDPRFHFHRVRCLPCPQPLRILTFAYKSARLIGSERFDLTFGFGRTYGHDLHRDSNGTFKAFRRALGKTFSRSNWYCRTVEHLERKLYTNPKLYHTVAVSDFIRRQVRERYRLPEDRISAVYNGVDSTHFNPANRRDPRLRRELGISPDRLVALFVGNDWRRKGLARAIEGIRHAERRWDLWILGEDRRERDFHRLVRNGGLQGRVRFLGRRDSRPYYAAADVFLFPSLFDPLANVILEAMASGLPVVLSPADGASELIRHEETGFIVENPDDPHELASFLKRLADPKLREAVGLRASKSVEALTWDRHFNQLQAIFDRIAEAKAELQPA